MPLLQLDNRDPIRGLKLNFNKLNTFVRGAENGQNLPFKGQDLGLKPLDFGNKPQDSNQDPKDLILKPKQTHDLINLDSENLGQQQQQAGHENNLIFQTEAPFVSRIPRLSIKVSEAANKKPSDSKALITRLNSLAVARETSPQEFVPEEQEEIVDIDKSHSRDAIYLVCDIAKDIYDYMHTLEDEQSVRENFLKDQKIFTPKVRQRLVNWCIEIHYKLKLLPETMYMTISILDRYFNLVQVKQQDEVQLVALSATLIASKYEEIYAPSIEELRVLCQYTYSRNDILKVERTILEELNFDLGKPIPLAFLRRYSRAAQCDLKMHSIAKYLMELSLTEYECSHWRPSLLAATSLYITIYLLLSDQPSSRRPLGNASCPATHDGWTRSLVHYTRYNRTQLQGPAALLSKILKKAQKNPQLFYCVKKHQPSKWGGLKSHRVDELIRLGEKM